MCSSATERQEKVVRRELQAAITGCEDRFEQVRERLEELALEHDDDAAMQAWQSMDDLLRDFEGTMAQAQEAGGRDE